MRNDAILLQHESELALGTEVCGIVGKHVARIRPSLVGALALSCCAQFSGACGLDLSREIAFPGGSSDLQAGQFRKLVDWYVELRDSAMGIADVSVYAYSIKGDAASLALVTARVAAVTGLVRTIGQNSPASVRSRGSEGDADRAQQFPEVVVGVQPQCAATQTCCRELPRK